MIAPWFLAHGRITDRVANYASAQGISMAEPLGSHNLLTVRSGEDTLKVSTSPRLFPEPDSSVWLRLEPNRIRWMDPETGAAVDSSRPVTHAAAE